MQFPNRTNPKKPNGTPMIGGRLGVILFMALCIAMSTVLKRFGLTVGPFRISFENLPIILSGFIFGPAAGAAVGALGDISGCIISGYAINPIITAGAAVIGIIPGLMMRRRDDFSAAHIICAIALAHLFGSVIIKSFGLFIYYHYPIESLLLRIPLYIMIGGLESYVTWFLLKNKAFRAQLTNARKKQ